MSKERAQPSSGRSPETKKEGSDAYEIRKMAPEHEQLCALLREVFELPQEKTGYPEEAKKAVRNYFTQLGYPVWALYYVPGEIDRTYSIMKPALEKLDHWLSVSDEDISAVNQTFIKDLVGAFEDAGRDLRRAGIRRQASYSVGHAGTTGSGSGLPRFSVSKDHFEKGMENFISEKQSGLLVSMECLGLQLPDVMPLLSPTTQAGLK